MRQILGTDVGVVALTDETQTEIQAKACSGTRTDILKRLALPVRELFAGAVSTEPLCNEAWGYDLPIPHIAELIAEEGIVSSLAAPMWHGGRLYGYVATMMRQPRHFSKQDTQLLTQLALQVVIAIENAELYRKARYVSILEERDRLAREMHDNLAQMLGNYSATNVIASRRRRLRSNPQHCRSGIVARGLLRRKKRSSQ